MFFGKQVVQGILGVPAPSGGVTYNWIFLAGPSNNTAQYTLDTFTETSRGTIAAGGTGNPGSFGNESYGWFCAGFNANVSTAVSRFDNASIANNSQFMSAMSTGNQQNGMGGGCYKAGQAGYTFGGTGGGSWRNLVLKLSISGDSWSTLAATLGNNSGWNATHNNNDIALISGGYDGNNITTNNKFTFSTDTNTTAGMTALAQATRDWCATGDQTNAYCYCGSNATVGITTIRKLGMTNGVQATTFVNSNALRYADGAGSDTQGVFTGGEGTGTSTLVREVVYATDTFTSRSSLSTGRDQHGAYSGAQTA